MSSESIQTFALEEIKEWGLGEPESYAALPPIQRGFVWKPQQVEYLWDSIASGFPIGSLLLAPMPEGGNTDWKAYNGCIKRNTPPTWQLLDGQQRVTTIIKGFHDIWTPREGFQENNPVSALWVDIAPKDIEKTDRRFLFRLVIKSHPWGYKRTDCGRISVSEARKALEAFRRNDDSAERPRRPDEFKLCEVFPWDAEAPVPLALLLKALLKAKESQGDTINPTAKNLTAMLKRLPLWNDPRPEKLERAWAILCDPTAKENEHFQRLVEALDNALKAYRIPGIVMNLPENDNQSGAGEHPAALLFKRINTGGEPLSREEIQYSMLKAVWPEAPKVIEEKVLENRQLCTPARMLSMLVRLYLTIEKKTPEDKEATNRKGMQGELSLREFETFIKNHQTDFRTWVESKATGLVETTWHFLVHRAKGDIGLPKVLAADLTRGHQDLVLLLMYWLAKRDAHQIERQRARTLGFLTAIAWYAPDKYRCLSEMGKRLVKSCPEDAFNQALFRELLKTDEQGRVRMLPLPSPEMVEQAFRIPWGAGQVPAFSEKSEIWKKNDFWELYPVSDSTYPRTDEERRLLNKIFDAPKWRALLFAQRDFLKTAFDWFDPTQPDAVSERNRPWDYDHILPHSWAHDGRGKLASLPPMVRIWIDAIGNFRAWPMELNRSKQDSAIFENAVVEYDLEDPSAVLTASFVSETDKAYWQKLGVVSSKDDFRGNHEGGNHEAWRWFIEASLRRTVIIYREWYRCLCIRELSPPELAETAKPEGIA